MQLLDFNAALGGTRTPPNGFERRDALLAEMDRLGIQTALVHHMLAAEGDIARGNHMLLKQLGGCDRMLPCWVCVPPALGDFPPPSETVQQARSAGVRAMRLFPLHSLYSLSAWVLGPLLTVLELAQMPLVLDYGTFHWSQRRIPWEEVRRLCEDFPRLSIVVLGPTVGDTRDMVALLHRLPNLLVEMHAFALPEGLALLAREGLASKTLFGTGLPQCAGECAAEQARRADLTPQDRCAFMAGNARRILGLEAHEQGAPAMDALTPIPSVIDAHAHIGAWERTITPVRTPDAILRSMDRCGVHKIVMSSFSAIHGEMQEGNRETAEALRHSPDRLYGYAAIAPRAECMVVDELNRCFRDSTGFIGLKLHCGLHETPLQDPAYGPALAFAHCQHLPVLVHGEGTDDWTAVARDYPDAAFIIAHGCMWNGWEPIGKARYTVAAMVENVFVDVAGSAAHRGAMRALVDLVGVDKVLFGSDFPMFDLAFELGRVTGSTLSVPEKEAICGGNAARLFTHMMS